MNVTKPSDDLLKNMDASRALGAIASYGISALDKIDNGELVERTACEEAATRGALAFAEGILRLTLAHAGMMDEDGDLSLVRFGAGFMVNYETKGEGPTGFYVDADHPGVRVPNVYEEAGK